MCYPGVVELPTACFVKAIANNCPYFGAYEYSFSIGRQPTSTP